MTSTTESNGRSVDLTLHLLKYREAARHVWNLREDETFASGSLPDGFLLARWEAIQDELFAALALRTREEHRTPDPE